MDYVSVTIKKPLYGNFVYVRDIYVNNAIRLGVKLKITVPGGSAVVDPKEWKEKAIADNKVMKKVFKRPDQPMVLYGGTVPLPPKPGEVETKTKRNLEDDQISLFSK
jgi:hypothetical protein